MAFLDFNAAEGAHLQAIASRAAPAPRMWLRPRPPAQARPAWQRIMPRLAMLVPAIGALAALASDYLDDPLLGMLAAVLLYATSAPIAARLVGGDGAAVRADHTKI